MSRPLHFRKPPILISSVPSFLAVGWFKGNLGYDSSPPGLLSREPGWSWHFVCKYLCSISCHTSPPYRVSDGRARRRLRPLAVNPPWGSRKVTYNLHTLASRTYMNLIYILLIVTVKQDRALLAKWPSSMSSHFSLWLPKRYTLILEASMSV